MRIFFALFIVFATISYAQAANPSVKTKFTYYNIEGHTAKELKRQMRKKGPKGFWAYTNWYVNWSSNCKVRVSIKITLPKWVNRSDASPGLKKSWDSMISSLKKHELNHGEHGINASKELVVRKCKNGKKTIQKWSNQDKIYDRKTKHGKKEGVVL